MARFISQNSTPPGGVYFFELDGERVQSRSKIGICALVKMLYHKRGLVVPHTPFDFVMDYMCPYMPRGFCSGGTCTKDTLSLDELRRNTEKLFGFPVVSPVVMRERVQVCVRCPYNSVEVCPSCGNLLDWAIKGMNCRSRIPADELVYVCVFTKMMISVMITFEDIDDLPGGCPEKCWRRYEREG